MSKNKDVLISLLSNTYCLQIKSQNFHWNITGPNFSAFHALFEDEYTNLFESVDEIAERLRQLGFYAPGSIAEYGNHLFINEVTAKLNTDEMLKDMLASHESIVKFCKDSLSSFDDDAVTQDLLIGRVAYHEKRAWIYKSSM